MDNKEYSPEELFRHFMEMHKDKATVPTEFEMNKNSKMEDAFKEKLMKGILASSVDITIPTPEHFKCCEKCNKDGKKGKKKSNQKPKIKVVPVNEIIHDIAAMVDGVFNAHCHIMHEVQEAILTDLRSELNDFANFQSKNINTIRSDINNLQNWIDDKFLAQKTEIYTQLDSMLENSQSSDDTLFKVKDDINENLGRLRDYIDSNTEKIIDGINTVKFNSIEKTINPNDEKDLTQFYSDDDELTEFYLSEKFAHLIAIILKKKTASVIAIKRFMPISVKKANEILNELCELNIISAKEPNKPRKVIVKSIDDLNPTVLNILARGGYTTENIHYWLNAANNE